MGNIVFGVEIRLRDHLDIVSPDSDIGLYSRTSAMASDAASGQPDVVVSDGTVFEEGDLVLVSDSGNSEEAQILSITGNTLTMFENLSNSYTAASSGIVEADSVFRWIQNDIDGLSGWKSGMIVDGGVSPYTRSIDLSSGGNTSSPGACGVTIKNTEQFGSTISALDVTMVGLQFFLYEFDGTSKTRRWYGRTDTPEWDSTTYRIPAYTPYEERNCDLISVVDNSFAMVTEDDVGEEIPVTIGEIQKAEFVRTQGYESLLRIGFLTYLADTFPTYPGDHELLFNTDHNRDITIFPIVNTGTTGDTSCSIRVANSIAVNKYVYDGTPYTSGTLDISDMFTARPWYIKCVSSDGDGPVDEYRKINSVVIYLDASAVTWMIGYDIPFSKRIRGNSDANDDNQCWVSLVLAERIYECDTWPCHSHVDTNGDPTDLLTLYGYGSEKSVIVDEVGKKTTINELPDAYYMLPEFIYSQYLGDNNKIRCAAQYAAGDIDSTVSVITAKPTYLYKITDATLSGWGDTFLGRAGSMWYKKTDGIYFGDVNNHIDLSSGSAADTYDRDYNTSMKLYDRGAIKSGSGSAIISTILCFRMGVPDAPDAEFDSVAVGIDADHDASGAATTGHAFVIVYKRWIGDPIVSFISPDTGSHTYTGLVSVRNLMDAYYSSNEPSTNDTFYHVHTNTATTMTGRDTFILDGITSKNEYNAIKEIAIFAYSYSDVITGSIDHTLDVREVCMFFIKKSNVKGKLYSPMKGRIFDDTFGGRKTASDLIEKPLDVYEHVCRLQNWSNVNQMPSAGWGKGYPKKPLIKTTGDGSFDATDPDLSALASFRVSWQTHDAKTSDMKFQLCRAFHLAGFVDENGYECVRRIKRSETSPSDTITLADIVDRKSIKISEPDPSKVYCEPFVRYDYNMATGKYDGYIKIGNVSAQAYSSSYVSGLSSGIAEEYWNRCHALWKKTNMIIPPPETFTDLPCIADDSAATEYLTNAIDWMYNPTIEFKVHYNKASEWMEAHRFLLQLPHQTDNVQVECLLTGISVDVEPPYHVTISAMMFSETIPEDFNLQDTMTVFGSDSDWQDHMDTYAERGSGLDDRQDTD